MEPDYSTYSQRELLEAYESIDRETYPERFALIKQYLGAEEAEHPSDPFYDPNPQELTGHFQNTVKIGITIGVLFFVAGVLGGLKVWHQGLDDYRQLALASGIFLGPYTVWHVRRRWRLHQHDYIQFDAQGVEYEKSNELKVFTWAEIDTLWLHRYRYLMRLTLEAKSGDAFTLLLVHYGLETDEVKEFVRKKALIHGFKFKKFTALLYSRNLAK